MIHIIFGAPGCGKTSLQTYKAKEIYRNNGRALLAACRSKIDSARNDGYDHLSYPDRAPLYSNFPIRFKTGYEQYYETYMINGYYMGLAHGDEPVMCVPPAATVFLAEGQRFYYSRKSQTFPDWVSRFYEMHRHFGLEIYIDIQRPILIDANIRELCEDFIEIYALEHKREFSGRIVSTTWHCREWDSWKRVEAYMSSDVKNYAETTYTNRGDIFGCYNSFSYFDNFLPKNGKDFAYLEHEYSGDAPAEFYDPNEPENYRGGKKQ